MNKVLWGEWQNPDTTQGVQAYEDAGILYRQPQEIARLSSSDLQDITRACGSLLTQIYNGRYPLSSNDAEQLSASIEKGDTHLFTLTEGEHLVAMAALVDQPNQIGGVRFSELGRAGSTTRKNGQAVSSRALLTTRVPWALENLDADFLYSFTRAAAEPHHGIPNAKGVQSVWWGARAYGATSPLITTNAGWYYRLGDVEPFNGFTMPTKPQDWAVAAAQQEIYVPSQTDKHILDTLIQEGTGGNVRPPTTITSATKTDFGLLEINPASDKMVANYVITENQPTSDLTEVNKKLHESIGQRAVIESDVMKQPRNASVMQQLHENGWTLTGWEPSSVKYGGRCAVFARVNPALRNNLISPSQRPEYFDRTGLKETRLVLDAIYKSLRQHAHQARSSV